MSRKTLGTKAESAGEAASRPTLRTVAAEAGVAVTTVSRALADDPAALVDHLDRILSNGLATEITKTEITQALEDVPLSQPGDPNYDGPGERVRLAVLMMMTSPDYLVQR